MNPSCLSIFNCYDFTIRFYSLTKATAALPNKLFDRLCLSFNCCVLHLIDQLWAGSHTTVSSSGFQDQLRASGMCRNPSLSGQTNVCLASSISKDCFQNPGRVYKNIFSNIKSMHFFSTQINNILLYFSSCSVEIMLLLSIS